MYERRFMLRAIKCAEKACAIDDVPVGCVIVHDGKVIASGYNRRENDKNALKHAEITAINRACKKLGGWRLIDCDMYVTLEPCTMCGGAIMNSRIKNVYVGLHDQKSGAFGSVCDLSKMGLNHKVNVEFGYEEEKCYELLHEYFLKLRELRKKKKEIAKSQS